MNIMEYLVKLANGKFEVENGGSSLHRLHMTLAWLHNVGGEANNFMEEKAPLACLAMP